MAINKIIKRPDTTMATAPTGEWGYVEFGPTGDLRTADSIEGQKFLAAGDRIQKLAVLSISGVTTGMTAWQNPEADTIFICEVILYATTVSSGASTIDVGTTATSATTTSDDIFDGIDGTTTAPVVYNMTDPALDSAANVKVKTLASGKWITVDSKTGDLAGFVGKLYIYYTNV